MAGTHGYGSHLALRSPDAGDYGGRSGFLGGTTGVVAAREELAELEERMSMQVLRLQEQSERFMDIMLRPLEAKVCALEERQPALEARLGELLGGIQGLQSVSETHTQRADAMEARFRRWRKLLEDDFAAKQAELKQELSSLVLPQGAGDKSKNYATRDDLLDVASLLKQELRTLVDGAMPRERELILNTQQECSEVAAELQAQVAELQEQVLGGATPAQRDLCKAAEALRQELRRLSEQKLAAEAGGGRQASALRDLEQVSQRCRRELAELGERARLLGAASEDMQRDVRVLREELAALKARELGLEAVTRPEAERIAEQALERLLHERTLGRLSGRGSPASFGCTRRSELDADGAADGRESAKLDAVAVMVEAAAMRLDALEERQRSWRQEAAEQDVDGRLERTWKVVEEEATLRARLQRSLEELAARLAALERRGGAEARPAAGAQMHREAAQDSRSEFKVEIAEVWRAIAELAELSGASGLEGAPGSRRHSHTSALAADGAVLPSEPIASD